MSARVLLAAALCLGACAATAAAADEPGTAWTLSIAGSAGYAPLRADYLEAHRQHPDPDEIDVAYIEPSNAEEANAGIRYFASHTRLGPRLDLAYGGHFFGHFSVGLLRSSLTATFSRDVSVTHPPSTTLLPNGYRETTRLDEGVDFELGAGMLLEANETFRIRLGYILGYGVARMHAGSFFLTQMQGEYSFFLHRLLVDLSLRLPLEDVGVIAPSLGLGGVLYRGKVEMEQRQGTEEWRMEWTQEKGYTVHAGLRIDSGVLTVSLDVLLFGERSLRLGVGVRF